MSRNEFLPPESAQEENSCGPANSAGPHICAAIGVAQLNKALALARQESREADVIEIRLDCLQEKRIEPFFQAAAVPLLFTNRPLWEGGQCGSSETERIGLLAQAAACGADYVDCELRAPAASRRSLSSALSGCSTRLILSWHDFKATPTTEVLHKTVTRLQEQGADIGKIVTTANSHLDVLRVLGLQELAAELQFPLIAFCMGPQGMISRVATLKLGGYMTYCAPAQSAGTASGQMSCRKLRSILAGLD